MYTASREWNDHFDSVFCNTYVIFFFICISKHTQPTWIKIALITVQIKMLFTLGALTLTTLTPVPTFAFCRDAKCGKKNIVWIEISVFHHAGKNHIWSSGCHFSSSTSVICIFFFNFTRLKYFNKQKRNQEVWWNCSSSWPSLRHLATML